MRSLRCFSLYSLCTVSVVLTVLSESTVVSIRFHIFQLQLFCQVTDKTATALLDQGSSLCVIKKHNCVSFLCFLKGTHHQSDHPLYCKALFFSKLVYFDFVQFSYTFCSSQVTTRERQHHLTQKMWSVNLWWYRLRVPTRTPHLRAQHHRYTETCCKIISRNSQNFLKIRICRNFAKMLVSWRRLRKDSSSSQLRRDLRLCRHHIENTLNLETSQHPEQEDGFVHIRRSAQSWMWNSILTKNVIALI